MLLTRFFFTGEFDRHLEVLRAYPHERLSFEKGDYLCRPSEMLDRCYFITSGMTRLSVIHDSGDEKVFGFWGKGSIYPLVVTKQDFALESSILLQAVTYTEALAFPVDAFRRALEEHPSIACEAIDHYTRFTNSLLFESLANDFESIQTRIASFLSSYLHYLPSVDNSIALSQEEIASIIGTTRVSVAKELAELRRLGIVKTARNRVYVIKPKALRDLGSTFLREDG